MALLSLTQGYSAIIDDEDFERLAQYNWFVLKTVLVTSVHLSAGRWVIGSKPRKCIRVHYDVLNIRPIRGLVIDHINRNSLDNRKENLQISNKRQNFMNSNHADNASGVRYEKARCTWKAFAPSVYGKAVYLGSFKTREQAVEVRRAYMANH
jgi:hypothetical protein